jgi:hypothetical protein
MQSVPITTVVVGSNLDQGEDASNPCCKKPQCTSNNTPGTVTGFPTPFGQTVSPPRNPNTPTPAPVMKGKHKKFVRH